MSDALTATAAGLTAKIAGLSAGAVVACLVVMAMTKPRTSLEWAVALTCTVMASVAGGAYLAIRLGLAHLDATFYGMATIIGLAFAAGLPAWLLVRMVFSWAAGESASLLELIRELRKLRQGGRDDQD